MTTSAISATLESVSVWPLLEAIVPDPDLEVLSLHARPGFLAGLVAAASEACSAADLSDGYLLGTGYRFDGSRELALKLAERSGPWDVEADISALGAVVADGRTEAVPLDVLWGLRSVASSNLADTFDYAAKHTAIVVLANGDDVPRWAPNVVADALGAGLETRSLFAAAVRICGSSAVVVRVLSEFGDPPTVDIVGRHEILEPIRSLFPD